MASKRKLRGMIEELLGKARADKVNWQVKGVFEEGRMPVFVVVVASGSMDVGFRRPKGEPEEYVFFLREGGETEEIRTSDPESKDWRLLAALYAQARRAVDNESDEKGIERKAKRRGVIGKEKEPDLPFWAAGDE
jgi:hypothetical protein